jgi:hypothetical protein
MYGSIASVVAVAAQLGLVGSTFAVASLSPPARGEFLLVPLTAHAAQQVARLAIEHDALLLSPGPVAGSLIVEGERARLAQAMLSAGIVPLAAPTAPCGARSGSAVNG